MAATSCSAGKLSCVDAGQRQTKKKLPRTSAGERREKLSLPHLFMAHNPNGFSGIDVGRGVGNRTGRTVPGGAQILYSCKVLGKTQVSMP